MPTTKKASKAAPKKRTSRPKAKALSKPSEAAHACPSLMELLSAWGEAKKAAAKAGDAKAGEAFKALQLFSVHL